MFLFVLLEVVIALFALRASKYDPDSCSFLSHSSLLCCYPKFSQATPRGAFTPRRVMLFIWKEQLLVEYFGNDTGADRSAAFADSEAEAFFNCDRSDELNLHIDVVAGHNHFNACGQFD